MTLPSDIEEQFFAGQRSERVQFAINDPVRIISGPHAGRTAAVISLVQVDPQVVFILEPGEPPWGDLEIPQSSLALIE